ncbi:MAG: hypothetical protein BGO10_03745 [Chlamydia sp. 32-24]|nr:MAG: hypothetical protein BGO10_03745 [Chlamydia sp. 32-24]
MSENINLLSHGLLRPKKSPRAKSSVTYIKTDNGPPVSLLKVAGTYYDKGFSYGFHFSEAIKHNLQATFRFASRIGIGRVHQKVDKEAFQEKIFSLFKHVPFHYLEQMQGIIDGCKEKGNPLDNNLDLLIVVSFFEMNELMCCSMFGITPPASTDHTFHLANSEYPYRLGHDEYPVLIIHEPHNEHGEKVDHTFLNLGYASLTGSITGINEKGLAFSQIRATFLEGGFNPEGIPYPYLIEEGLRICNDVSEANELIKDKPKTSPKFYVVSDPNRSKKSVQLWFTAPEYFLCYKENEMPATSMIKEKLFAFYEPVPNAVYWLDMLAPKIAAGSEKAYYLIKNAWGHINHQKALEITKELGSRYLVLSALYDLDKLTIDFSFSYKRVPAHLRTYIHLELKELFNI